MASAPTLLPGQSPPLTIITADDKSGLVLIVTALGLAFALVSIIIRVYVRHEFSPRQFAWDDAVIGFATMFSIFQNAAVFVEVHYGFGKILDHITPYQLVEIQKASYASDILYIITVWLTKYSVAFLFLRLSPDHRHVMACKIVMLVAAVTGVVSIFIVALRCNLSHPWLDINTQCTGLFTRWQVVAAFDITTETSLFAIAIFMVYGLQMSLYKKMVVVFAFGMRLLVIIAIAFRLHYISEVLHSSDPTLTGVYAVICTQVAIDFAIIAATIPCLRPFMTATATNYGAPAPKVKSANDTKNAVNGTPRSRSLKNPTNGDSRAGFNLSSLSGHLKSKSSRLTSRQHSEKDDKSLTQSSTMNGTGTQNNPGIYGSDSFGQHDATIGVGRPRDANSIESTESKQMIIRKDVDYSVEYDERDGKRYSGVSGGEAIGSAH